jgi:hypothetical protein
MMKFHSCFRRLFDGLIAVGVVIAAVIVVAVADPTVSPVQAQAASPVGDLFLSQLSSDIDGESAYDKSGWSVALSADGGTAIIGAPENSVNGTDSGQARIYTWTDTGWTQQGQDIDGEAANDQSGYSVALSADGRTAIIGAPHNYGGNGASPGCRWR